VRQLKRPGVWPRNDCCAGHADPAQRRRACIGLIPALATGPHSSNFLRAKPLRKILQRVLDLVIGGVRRCFDRPEQIAIAFGGPIWAESAASCFCSIITQGADVEAGAPHATLPPVQRQGAIFARGGGRPVCTRERTWERKEQGRWAGADWSWWRNRRTWALPPARRR